MTIATPARLLALALSALAPDLTAQDVYLSEVRADGAEAWIELHNRGAVTADIGTWSLHVATTTPGTPQNYWWGFPLGTTLAPDEYLRVHWFQSAPATPTPPGELYTGATPYDFLFGLGGEALSGDEGAVALFRSQSNEQMSSSALLSDWVGWGTSGFQREPLAVTAGLWVAGRHAPSIPPTASIARDPVTIGATTFPDETWFVDHTPTPGMPNVTGAVLEPYGAACALPGHHLLGLPELRASSLPLFGNGQFSLTVDHTTGIFGEFVLVGFSAGAAPANAPSILPAFSGFGCQEAIDPTLLISTWLVPATLLSTTVPLPLDNLPPGAIGAELHVQALVLELLPTTYPPYQGISNALRVVVGQ